MRRWRQEGNGLLPRAQGHLCICLVVWGGRGPGMSRAWWVILVVVVLELGPPPAQDRRSLHKPQADGQPGGHGSLLRTFGDGAQGWEPRMCHGSLGMLLVGTGTPWAALWASGRGWACCPHCWSLGPWVPEGLQASNTESEKKSTRRRMSQFS